MLAITKNPITQVEDAVNEPEPIKDLDRRGPVAVADRAALPLLFSGEPKRRLALFALLAAVAGAAVVFPFRTTWWGGFLLAVFEAGVVGGVADWFAVTALFRRPLGLPIPHTALIPNNWELMASRVGTMVGNRILTKRYVQDEIDQMDIASLLETLGAKINREDIQKLTTIGARWVADQLSHDVTEDLATRLRNLVDAWPLTPGLVTGLEAAREHGWNERAVTALVRAATNALDSSSVRSALEGAIDDALSRYQKSLGRTARFLTEVGAVLGMLDSEKLVAALQAGLREIGNDPAHPVRGHVMRALNELPDRLRVDSDLVARVELFKTRTLESAPATRLLAEAARELRLLLVDDLRADPSELTRWLTDQLDEARLAFVRDKPLRLAIDRWAKRWVLQLLDCYHGQVAAFIENGVRVLGPAGAVRLIEEHAGDDLQFIRLNGTIVGGFAGGAIYAVRLLLSFFGL